MLLGRPVGPNSGVGAGLGIGTAVGATTSVGATTGSDVGGGGGVGVGGGSPDTTISLISSASSLMRTAWAASSLPQDAAMSENNTAIEISSRGVTRPAREAEGANGFRDIHQGYGKITVPLIHHLVDNCLSCLPVR